MGMFFLRQDFPGHYRLRRGHHEWGFTASAFLNVWFSSGKTFGVQDWLREKGLDWALGASITPTALRKADSKHGRWVGINALGEGWGGARSHAGRKPVDMLPELREECMKDVERTNCEAAFLRYEAAWERKNGRKAPKSLLAGFRRELRERICE